MAQHLGDAAGDGEPEAEPLLPRGAGVIEAGEFVKDSLLLVQRDAGAVVPHLDAYLVPQSTATKQHPATGVVAKRIGEEVLQHPPQQAHVAVDGEATLHHGELDPSRLGQHPKLGLEVVEHVAQGEIELLRLELARLQP
ncbi:hypothetical protein D3C75_939300 [compost metagenome]